jgi:hypothetical protein
LSKSRIIPIIERIFTMNTRDSLPEEIRKALANRTITIPDTASVITLATPSEKEGI